jgi:MscS family membrane protein
MGETNTTKTAIDNVVETGTQVIDGLNIDLYRSIQPWLNKLYSGTYSEYFSMSFFGIPLANIIAAILAFLFFLLLRKLFTSIIVSTLLRITARTKTTIDDMIVRELRDPLRFFFIVLGLRVFFQLIFRETHFIKLTLDALTIYTVFWVLYAITPALKELLYRYSHTNDHLSYELTNFLIRIVRIFIVLLGVMAVLYNFGINVTAFFASLGIGGLALALAAKDTAANLFGSVALLVDRSVKVGEWIKVDGIEGTVEDIGMRTTKIRTFEKSIIAIPNSIVANSHIENFSRRGIRRIKLFIGLTYDTPRTTIEAILTDLRTLLRTHPDIAQNETQLVNFRDFNASDLGIMIYTFAAQSEWKTYLNIREDINLKIIEIFERHHASFAFPSQSVYVESMPHDTFVGTNPKSTSHFESRSSSNIQGRLEDEI